MKKGVFGRIVKGFFATVAVMLAVSLAAVLLIDGYVRISVSDRILDKEEAASLDADCILVLGASVRPGGIPSDMLRDRLDTGIELYKLGASDRFLMSGDHAEVYYDEVNAMKNYAKDAGVDSSVIFMDHAGLSTYESMYRAKEIFGVEKVVIVTQEYHLSRAVYDAKALGIDAYGVASDQHVYQNMLWNHTREFMARNKDFFYCIVKPEPTVLGEKIPITGNGDMTNDG